jgi:hypothetical protein
MNDPAIIEAAARALQDSLGNTLLPILNRHVASTVITAVAPLIRAAALEEAAVVAERYLWKGDPNWIADNIRALKELQP